MKSIPFILALLYAGFAFGVNKPQVQERSSGFLENKGQIIDQNDQLNPNVLFLLPGKGLNVQLRKTGFSYDIYEPVPTADSILNFHRLDINFENLNPAFEVVTEKPSDDYLNYYTTGTSEAGAANIRSYQQVTYRNIYPGIDVVFYANGNNDGFKYDFVVHPGADSRQIRLRYNGMNDVPETVENALTLSSRFGTFTEKIPSAFFRENNTTVQVSFNLHGNLVTYDVQSVDPMKTLIIDPMPNRLWATYYGGSALDVIREIIGSSNEQAIYGAGWTSSSNNIATSGAFQSSYTAAEDCFLFRMNALGQRVWGTYLGGSSNDRGSDIIDDNVGNVYISGLTYSTNFGTTSGAMQSSHGGGSDDGFIARFDTTGKRMWSTYFGGNGFDELYKMTINRANHLFIGGKTSSSNVIATSGAHQGSYGGSEDGFVLKMDTLGRRIWSTYLGGTGQDYLNGISCNSNSTDLFVTCWTSSSNAMSTSGTYQVNNGGGGDMSLIRFDSSGQRIWGTYYGGSNLDYGSGMISDSTGSYLYGYTLSTSAISTSGAHQPSLAGGQDGFLAKFSHAGQILWSTYYGGSGDEQIYDFQFYENGSFIISGYTASSNNMSSINTWQQTKSTGDDGFIARFNTSGLRDWGSYYGSTGLDRIYSHSIHKSSIYLSGITTSGSSLSTSGIHQSTYGGSQDGFIAKFEDDTCVMFSLELSRKTEPLCTGDSNGVIEVYPINARYPVKFSWKPMTTLTDSIATKLPSGVYRVIAKDSRNCTDSLDIILQDPDTISVKFKISNISCYGDKNGKATAVVSGGTGPYTYAWNTIPVVRKDSVQNLGPGFYTVTVTDKNLCTKMAVVQIAQPDSLIATIASIRDVSCFGLNDGNATATVKGGTSPYKYSWSTSPVQTAASAYNLTVGYYTLKVSDFNKCSTSVGVNIQQPPPLMVAVVDKQDVTCYGEATGQVTVKVWGGTPAYTLNWTGGTNLSGYILSGLKSGTYRLTVRDANNCVNIITITIQEPPPITFRVDSIRHVTCFGGRNGEAYFNVSGGRPPYQFLWNSVPIQYTPKVTQLSVGRYFVTVIDTNGCRVEDTVRILQPDELKVTSTIEHVRCFGDSTGKIILSTTGGTIPYTYFWDMYPAVKTSYLYNKKAGSYLTTIIDKNKCSTEITSVVTEPPPLRLTLIKSKQISCWGMNDGYASILLEGGTPTYKISWSDSANLKSLVRFGLTPKTYTVVVSDTFGCSVRMDIQITEPSKLIGFFDSIRQPNCFGEASGYVSFKAGGGTPKLVYSWGGTASTNSYLTNIIAGKYLVSVTDSNGCVISDSVTINQPLAMSATTSKKDITCFGLNNGTASIETQGGTIPYSFVWNTIPLQFTSKANQLRKGFVGYTITDNHNCKLTGFIEIKEPEKLILKLSTMGDVSCRGTNDGTASVSASGGILPYSYRWNTVPSKTTSSVLNLYAGIYKAWVTDSNDCVDSVIINIAQPQPLQLTAQSLKNVTCYPGNDGHISIQVSQGVAPYKIKWSNGDSGLIISKLTVGVYMVVVTDKCGDTITQSFQISQPLPFKTGGIAGTLFSSPNNREFYLSDGLDSWTYNWSVTNGIILSGQGSKQIAVQWGIGHKEGRIQVSVMDARGCLDTVNYVVKLFMECFHVFPNPAGLRTTVYIPDPEQNYELEIFDARGRLVKSIKPVHVNEVDVSDMAMGIYFFRWKDCVIKVLRERN